MRARLQAVITSKWDGLRVVAARTLCQWGDDASVALVKTARRELVGLPNRNSAVAPICRTLGSALTEHDLDRAV